jgi:Zn-dependent M28 family amino/carboxypeptidase
VIGRLGSETGALTLVGAHDDACGNLPAADDNASGVAALIELGVLLGREGATPPFELAAYSLAEPPFFATPHMGSAVHARACAAAGRPITGMIALEMVGCFSDER